MERPTLAQSLELGGRNLLAVLRRDDRFLPRWSCRTTRDGLARCDTPGWRWVSHNIGRWWDAMLRLEAATGFAIPADAEAGMLDNLRDCVCNPLAVPCRFMEKPRQHLAYWIDEHSQREHLLALAALVRHRKSGWAAETGAAMVRALDSYIRPDGTYDHALLRRRAADAGLPPPEADELPAPTALAQPGPGEPTDATLTWSTGRMIEGLVEFHLAAGDTAALVLAQRLAGVHFQISTRPDGSAPAARYLHTHSFLGTLRGLFRLGQVTGNRAYIDRVDLTYRVAVCSELRESGFISHDWGKESDGETTSPGDAAQLALWLTREGSGNYLDDAERLVRSRILPSQIKQRIELRPAPDAEPGATSGDLGSFLLGAFGGMHQHPHGERNSTTDITAADIHTLCDILEHVADETPRGLRVNFHLDAERPGFHITTRAGATRRVVTLTPARGGDIAIRLPAWTPRETCRLSVDRADVSPCVDSGWVTLPNVRAGATVELAYDLPARRTAETLAGVTYRFAWRGDEIAGIRPNADYLPFYPSA